MKVTWAKVSSWLKKHWDSVVAPATIIAAIGTLCWVWITPTFTIDNKVQMTTGIGTLALAVAAAVYAWHTRKQANASAEMANTMIEQTKTLRETVSISVRPSISINLTRVEGGTTYPFEPPITLSFRLQNKGKGAARNLIVTCKGQDKKVEYSIIELPYFNVGDEQGFSIRRITDVSAKEIKVAYVTLEVIYNDELGEDWHATLEVDKDGKSWKAGETKCERL